MDKCYNGNHDRDRDGNCLTCPMTEPAKEWGEKLSRRVMQAPPDVNAAEVLAYEIAPLLSKASAYDRLLEITEKMAKQAEILANAAHICGYVAARMYIEPLRETIAAFKAQEKGKP